jgi:hypothetical protein
MHKFYGAEQGVRIARKHGKAYLQSLGISNALIQRFNGHETSAGQLAFIDELNTAVAEAQAA